MAFTQIVVSTPASVAGTFNPTGQGIYTKDTVDVGGPSDHFKLTPGRTSKTGRTTYACTRNVQKDVVVGDQTTRHQLTISVSIIQDSGFSTLEVDNHLAGVSDFFTEGNLKRIALGES